MNVNATQRVDFSAMETQAFSRQSKSSPDKAIALEATESTGGYQKFDINSLDEAERKKLEEELKKLNDSIVSYGKLLKFKYDEKAEMTYVEVIDTETQEVVASLPPEFLIDLSIRMKELIGMFIDKKL